jgi:7-cyano-7-deazaguanine tRNA-ribosyltransferase
MDYYISWTHSDPVYHEAIPWIGGVLVSPPNVNSVWHVGRWPSLPSRLLLDSGAFQDYKGGHARDPAAVLARQLAMIAGEAIPTGICHLDAPLLGTRDLAELDRRVTCSLARAQWLIDHTARAGLPSHVRSIGVIQGHTVERVYFVGRTLADMGYEHFALGSLAPLSASQPAEVLRRVEAALEAVGPDLHILGVSAIGLLPELARLGVRSVDSGAPMHEAVRGGIYYSRPFRRYKLASPHFREWERTYKFAAVLTEPLPCDCPVCREDSSRILEPQGKPFVNLRALHNCYHLAREFTPATDGVT